MADPRYNTRHCAIIIKGGTTRGTSHSMYIDIRTPDGDTFPWAAGKRKTRIGPIYLGHHWDYANGYLKFKGNEYTAELDG